MKVTLDLENLSVILEDTIKNNLNIVIKETIKETIQDYINKNVETLISQTVINNYEKFVNEYITTTKIKVGSNDPWSDIPAQEYTVEQFIKKSIKNCLDDKMLRIKKDDRYSSYETVAFEEYIKREFDPNKLVKKELDKFMDGIRKDINKTMKDTFDSSTKEMLSSAVLTVLNANDTYAKIQNNICCIADKQKE